MKKKKVIGSAEQSETAHRRSASVGEGDGGACQGIHGRGCASVPLEATHPGVASALVVVLSVPVTLLHQQLGAKREAAKTSCDQPGTVSLAGHHSLNRAAAAQP